MRLGIRSGRLGVTVSRKVGNSVLRNRIKRSVREWYRQGGAERVEGLDLVVIARRGARARRGREIWAELDELASLTGRSK